MCVRSSYSSRAVFRLVVKPLGRLETRRAAGKAARLLSRPPEARSQEGRRVSPGESTTGCQKETREKDGARCNGKDGGDEDERRLIGTNEMFSSAADVM